MKLQSSPWGKPDFQKEIAPGIISLSTPGHGGYWLSKEMRAQMPETLRRKTPFAGEGWYEEDCDWAIVVLAFPWFFTENERYFACRTAAPNPDFSPYFETDKGKATHAAMRKFQTDNGAKYSIGSMSSGAGINGWNVSAWSLDGTARIRFESADYPKLPQIFTLAEVNAIAKLGSLTTEPAPQMPSTKIYANVTL